MSKENEPGGLGGDVDDVTNGQQIISELLMITGDIKRRIKKLNHPKTRDPDDDMIDRSTKGSG